MDEGDKNKMNDFFEPANKGFGALGWTKRGFAEKNKASALIGRLIGLYDYVMDFETDMEKLADVQNRMNYFRTLAIWVDESLRKVKNAWASICSDYPGRGKADMADPSITVEAMTRWRDFEIRYLSAAETLKDMAHRLWGGDMRQMSSDLGFPFKEFGLITRWAVLIGDDVQTVLKYAKSRMETLEGSDIAMSATAESYDPFFATPFREEFVTAWKEMEDRLISLPRNKRYEVKA